jgi:hypothetical protein
MAFKSEEYECYALREPYITKKITKKFNDLKREISSSMLCNFSQEKL